MRPFLCVILAATLLSMGCAKRPVLYPNEHLNEVGREASEQEIKECMALADEADLDTNQGIEATKRTAGGAAVGGASGAVAGAISGRPGTGAAIGAATGAVGGFFSWLFRPAERDPVYVRYVDTCLQERGYKTIGWK